MRRVVILVGVFLAAAFAWSRARARGSAIPKPVTGIFSNGMAYVRLGSGPKNLLVIPGGPGNEAPSGLTVRMLGSQVRRYVESGPRPLGSTLARPLGALGGRVAYRDTHPEFASDVLVEAEAEVTCDARDVLPRISVPVLLVCGDRDVYFSKAVYEETARLIPDCTLQMYAGKGHMRVVSDGRVAEEVLDFVHRHPRVTRGR